MMRPYLITLIVPAIMLVLAIPLILEKVPRNYLYGFRTPYTMSSDQVWYHANRVAGLALLGTGLAWFVLGLVLPSVIVPPEVAYRYVLWIGLGCLGVAVVASFWLVYKR